VSPSTGEPTPPEVLSSLPRTRPQRRSPRRAPAGQTGSAATGHAKPAARAKRAAKTAPARAKTTAARPKTTAARPKTTAARPKTTAARPKTTTAQPKTTTAARPKTTTAARPKTANTPSSKPPFRAEPQGPVDPPSGAEMIEAAVQGAGELAQIGLTLGGQLLRSAIRRLPRP
jgi:hypothetical protein